VITIPQMKVHLVFARHDHGLEAELSENYRICGQSRNLAEACLWAARQMKVEEGLVESVEAVASEPDILLINGLEHYRQEWKHKQNPDQYLMDQLLHIKQALPFSRFKLLLPESKNRDQDLLIDLMQNDFYDFWFLEGLSKGQLSGILATDRSFAEVEQYLQTLPLPLVRNETTPAAKFFDRRAISEWRNKNLKEVIFNKLRPFEEDLPWKGVSATPAHDSSISAIEKQAMNGRVAGTAVFWSEEDCLSIYAAAVQFAILLAAQGHKTILAEIPGSAPRLGAALGIRHPIWNIRNAMAQFAAGREDFYQQCIFNNEKYLCDNRAHDQHDFMRCYPELLFFCPDADEPIWKEKEAAQAIWERYLISWMQWAMFRQKFQFIIFLGFGQSQFQEIVYQHICYWKIIAAAPWANGFNRAQEINGLWPEQSLFLWNHDTAVLKKEISSLHGAESLIIPPEVYSDFLELSSFRRKPEKIQETTRQFLATLYGHMAGSPITVDKGCLQSPWRFGNRSKMKGERKWH